MSDGDGEYIGVRDGAGDGVGTDMNEDAFDTEGDGVEMEVGAGAGIIVSWVALSDSGSAMNPLSRSRVLPNVSYPG